MLSRGPEKQRLLWLERDLKDKPHLHRVENLCRIQEQPLEAGTMAPERPV